MTLRRLIVLLSLAAAIVGVQSATAANSPNMRLMYSLLDPTSGRTDSDIAFWGNIGVAGNYDGFRVFNTQTQQELVSFLCRGPQNDVSLWEHNGRLLLFQSIDTPQRNGLKVCSTVRSSDTTLTDPLGFEGIRIFDLTDPTAPVYLKGVRTNCGSHTNTLVPDLANNRVLIYATTASSSTGPYCQNPHNRIPIVAVPLNAPETASVIAEPRLIPGLRGCHDITVFLAINKAAAACESEGQFWDITDRANPGTTTPLMRIDPPGAGVNYWHSAEFTWDGQYVVFDDESFTNTCQPSGDGKIHIFRVSDAQLMSSFMIPRPQGSAYCSSHNGNIIPVLGKYLAVVGWYYGGTSVVDFTNPAQPQEVAYYDFTPTSGQSWSSYWYNGRIYSNDMNRGVDVFNMMTPYTPYGQQWTHLNAQTQENLYIPSVTALGQLSPSPSR
jgi:hypothetical protein